LSAKYCKQADKYDDVPCMACRAFHAHIYNGIIS